MDDAKYGKIVDFVHFLIKSSYADKMDLVAIDATVGNGYDTLFLCRLLQNTGFVYGFDIQEEAINNTSKLLESNKCMNYQLIKNSHSQVHNYIGDRSVDIAVFNLGYLPNNSKIIKTEYNTTLLAVQNIMTKLSECGRIYIASYILHDNGEEYSKLIEFVTNLDKKLYNVLLIKLLNKNNFPPEIIVIERN